jgi:hypothetical protein
MEQEHTTENNFTINVNGKTYSVTAYCEDDHCSRFKIETDCEYLFTLCTDDEGNWQIEKDVTILYEGLIDQIGSAIEEYDAAR